MKEKPWKGKVRKKEKSYKGWGGALVELEAMKDRGNMLSWEGIKRSGESERWKEEKLSREKLWK